MTKASFPQLSPATPVLCEPFPSCATCMPNIITQPYPLLPMAAIEFFQRSFSYTLVGHRLENNLTSDFLYFFNDGPTTILWQMFPTVCPKLCSRLLRSPTRYIKSIVYQLLVFSMKRTRLSTKQHFQKSNAFGLHAYPFSRLIGRC